MQILNLLHRIQGFRLRLLSGQMGDGFAVVAGAVYVVRPLSSIALTASIYLTVAIAIERYVAVHYPLDYNMVSRKTHSYGVQTSLGGNKLHGVK